MLLSNVAIKDAIEDGRLVISPFDGRQMDANSVNLSLDNIIQVPKVDSPITIKFGEGNVINLLEKHSTKFTINEFQPFELKPNIFILGTTKETVWFKGITDLENDGIVKDIREEKKRLLAGRVEGKSSYARMGLIVHFTAPTIHNGFHGRITLELINFGPHSIMLTGDKPICQLLIEEVLGFPSDDYKSIFQGQSQPSGSRND